MPPSPLKIVLALVLGPLIRGSAAIGCARRPGRDTGRRDEKERHAVPRPKAAKRVKSPHAAPDRKSPRARPRPFHIRCYPPAHPTPHPLRKLRWLSQRWYGESRCIGFVIAVGAGDRISEVVSAAFSLRYGAAAANLAIRSPSPTPLFQRSSIKGSDSCHRPATPAAWQSHTAGRARSPRSGGRARPHVGPPTCRTKGNHFPRHSLPHLKVPFQPRAVAPARPPARANILKFGK